jgi:hypothetical protein
MKTAIPRLLAVLTIALLATLASAQEGPATLKPNQTYGYGGGNVLTFRYGMNFDCIDQPTDDLNYNKIPADQDPGEMQTPICQVGTEPDVNPPGQHGKVIVTTEPLYVLVPMFSVDKDQNPNDAISCKHVVQGTICGVTLGKTLIKLFGAIPEGFKEKPLVYTQCPAPTDAPGTCTMHASRLDLGPVLAALGYIQSPTSNIFLPTPNHSHIVINMDEKIKSIWWQVRPVLVLDQNDWPNQGGTSGITSFADMQKAIKAKAAVEAPSNFFLFFSSYLH